ncbi:Glutaminyl-tRNA synthetase [Coemansia sp. RSA 2322]|uniref:glutamine--tRNA ligase n=1 Tax=Coemansia thaxteri TaxID=2663907 RepID=A0A9W8BIJ9_9FUNG|nr:Glutaminyl-tRNA synthetase [Coemansia thaxteri]KAJ2470190.1 Glutaminyl-tRNA synthetase [Coemansia sp. RSA 2322]KAJ2484391.1 Glutaminyl-tRNA synthetase [Coemansia sp. RSA 2320]
MADLITKFEALGLSADKAAEAAANKKLAPTLAGIIASTGQTGFSKSTGMLLYALATSATKDKAPHTDYIARAIVAGRIASTEQLTAATKFCAKNDPSANEAAFDEACGVGVIVNSEAIAASVQSVIDSSKETLLSERYRALGKVLGTIKKLPELRWADSGKVKAEFDMQTLALLGPKDERDTPAAAKAAPKPVAAAAANAAASNPEAGKWKAASLESMFANGEISRLHRPGENPQIKPELTKQHLAATKGMVITRFPPEPNGFLHIGHAKAINVNFGYAKTHGGMCNLRYDDTNPEKEEQEYVDSILDTIRWLGFEPHQVLYSSDYFQRLYELAVKLTEKGLAYVCHCTGEEINAQRGGEERGPRFTCKHRERPVSESLAEFQKMKEGRYASGEAILRMKMDMESGNTTMWDLVAYRVLYASHHRTGTEWCIYPTYDFTHCLCDSFENITHSLCTREFVQCREPYYWLCDALEVYKPVQWEYSRLVVTGTVLSKRKVQELRAKGFISALDDPRLYTLPALRRRGVPPEAINAFARELGVTTADTVIDVVRLENHIRGCLGEIAPRIMAAIHPLRVVLENVPEDHFEEVEMPYKPNDDSFGVHKVPFTRVMYIDSSDFREVDSADYYRLAPNKSVGLQGLSRAIMCTDVRKNADGSIAELVCRYEAEGTHAKPKTFIQWIADCPKLGSPVRLDEVRLYNPLFNHDNPKDASNVPGGWLSDVNKDSLEVVKGAIAEVGLWDSIKRYAATAAGKKELSQHNVETVRFQFKRIGYFALDKDTAMTLGDIENDQLANVKLVMNRVVTLKEDPKKD